MAVLNNMIVGKRNDSQMDWDEMNSAIAHLCVLSIYLMKKYSYAMQEIDKIECDGC